MQYRLRTLFLFVATCALSCAIAIQCQLLWLKASTVAVPVMWTGFVLLLTGRSLYHGDPGLDGSNAAAVVVGSLLVGAATFFIFAATALVVLSFLACPPSIAANLQFGLSLLYLRRGVWRLAIGNGIGALLFGLFCGLAAGSTTNLSSGYGLWMTSIGSVPIIAYLGALTRAGLAD